MDVSPRETQEKENKYEETERKLSQFLIRDFGDITPFRRRFRDLTTNAEKVDLTYQQMVHYSLLDGLFREDKKSDQNARRHKKKGDNSFAKGEIINSLGHFTRCIMQAESKELLGMAYANRSASLFKLQMYRESIADIDRAIEHSYPQQQRRSLVVRRNRAAELARKSPPPKHHELVPALPADKINPGIPRASVTTKVEIRKDEKQRSVVMATKQIDLGELISVESPIGHQLSSGKSELYHCHHCFKVCYNPIPCWKCTQVLYCGNQCREEASLKYHSNECPILSSLRQWVGFQRRFLLCVKMMFLSEDPNFREECFQYVHPLEQFLTTKFEDRELYQMSVVASGIFYLVNEHTHLFSRKNIEQRRQEFKGILLKQLRICYILASAITEVVPIFGKDPEKPFEVDHLSRDNVAIGMFPFYVHFKHSCTPNVVVHHYGVNKMLRAIRTIKQGNQLYISYGPNYYYQLKQVRGEHLEKWFHFTCACRACIGDYPLMNLQTYRITERHLPKLLLDLQRGSLAAIIQGVPFFTSHIGRTERQEDNLPLFFFTKSLAFCYDLLGNRRRIP